MIDRGAPNHQALPSGPSRSERERWVRIALDHLKLDDIDVLEDSPLADGAAARYLARTEFRRCICAKGLSLRKLLLTALADIGRDLRGGMVAALATTLHDLRPQVDLARERGTSEETISRTWKPKVVSHVTTRLEEFEELAQKAEVRRNEAEPSAHRPGASERLGAIAIAGSSDIGL